jgi:hypothetical protein
LGPLFKHSAIKPPEGCGDRILGTLSGPKSSMKDHGRKSLICGMVYENVHTTSLLEPVFENGVWLNPYVMAVDGLRRRCEDYTAPEVEEAYDDFLIGLDALDYSRVHVYDLDTTINGKAFVRGVDCMNFATSMGYPHRGPKSKHFPLKNPDDVTSGRTASPLVMQMYENRLKDYLGGYTRGVLFDAALKEEIVSLKKRATGKTRVFSVAPVEFIMLQRQFLLPLVRFMQEHRTIFECGVGVSAASKDWADLDAYMGEFENNVAGDFVEFDKRLAMILIEYAHKILNYLASCGGYSEVELAVLNGLGLDTATPIYSFKGDLLQVNGSGPSGHALTVWVNGLCQSLMVRIVFFGLCRRNCFVPTAPFRSYVHLLTYGDDDYMNISPVLTFFNNFTIRDMLAEKGMTFTTADKSEFTQPYDPKEKVTFLKRSWRRDEELGWVMAPLEEKSIWKMVNMYIESGAVSVEDRTIMGVDNAVREWFQYGRSRFEVESEKLYAALDSVGNGAFVFKRWTFDSLVEELRPYYEVQPLQLVLAN